MTRKKVYHDTKDLPPPPPSYETPELREAALPHLLTVAEVADVLRTSPKAVYALIQFGVLRRGAVRVGRRVLVDSKELKAWIDEQRAKPLVPWPDRPKPPLPPPPPPLPKRRRS